MSLAFSDCYIAWTPNRPEYPEGFRGKCRIYGYGVHQADLQPWAIIAGRQDARAYDPKPEIRQAYALTIAFVMSQRDGLDLLSVHNLMLNIREYRDGCCEEVLTEGSAP